MGGKNSSIMVHNSTYQTCYVCSDHSAEKGYLGPGQHLVMGIGPDGDKLVRIKCFDQKNREIKSVAFWCWCDDDWTIKRNGIQQVKDGREDPHGRFHPWGVDNESVFQQQDQLEEQRRREQEAARQRAEALRRQQEEEQMRAQVSQHAEELSKAEAEMTAKQEQEFEQLRAKQEARLEKEAEEAAQRRKDEIRENIENAKKQSTSQKNAEWEKKEREREEEEELNEFSQMNRKHIRGGRGPLPVPFNSGPEPSEYLTKLRVHIAKKIPPALQSVVDTEITAQLTSDLKSLGLNYSAADVHYICVDTLSQVLLSLNSLSEICFYFKFLVPNLHVIAENEEDKFDDSLSKRALQFKQMLENKVQGEFNGLSCKEICKAFSGQFRSICPFIINLVTEKAVTLEDKTEAFPFIKGLAYSHLEEHDYLKISEFICSVPYTDLTPEERLSFLEMFLVVIPPFSEETSEMLQDYFNFIVRMYEIMEDEEDVHSFLKSQIANMLADKEWFSNGYESAPQGLLVHYAENYPNTVSLGVELATYLFSILHQAYEHEHHGNRNRHFYGSKILEQSLSDEVALQLIFSSDFCLGDLLVNKILEIPCDPEEDSDIPLLIKTKLTNLIGKCSSLSKSAEGSIAKVMKYLNSVEPSSIEFPVILQLANHLGESEKTGEIVESHFPDCNDLGSLLLELVEKGYEVKEETIRILLEKLIEGNVGEGKVTRKLVLQSLRNYNDYETQTTALAEAVIEKVKNLENEEEWDLVGEILTRFQVDEALAGKVMDMVNLT